MKCPNKKSTAWTRLLGLVNGNEEKAMKSFISWRDNVPEDVIVAKHVINAVAFKSTVKTSDQLGRIFHKTKNYNRDNGTNHFVVATPTIEKNIEGEDVVVEYSLKLKIGLDRTMYGNNVPIDSYNVESVEDIDDINGEVSSVEYIQPPYHDRVAEVDGVTILNGNQYWFNGEMYNTMEDAIAAKDAVEYQMKASGWGKPITELDEYLTQFLAKYGITVKQINDFKTRFGLDGIAASDMLNKMVYVAQGKADATTLPEEAAHFIIEMLGEEHPLYKAMEKVVKDTEEYKEVIKEYSGVYGNNEKKLTKEAMGKILANRLIQAHESKNSSLLDRIIQWFKNIFKSAETKLLEDKINSAYDEVANGVISGFIGLNGAPIVDNGIMFQLSRDDAKKKLKLDAERLNYRAEVIRRKVEQGETDVSPDYKSVAANIIDKINANDIKNAISSLVFTLGGNTFEMEWMLEAMDSAEHMDSVMSSRNIKEMMETVDLYMLLLEDIEEIVKDVPEIKEYASIKDENGLSIRDKLRAIRGNLSTLQSFQKRQAKERVKNILEDISITYVGPDGKQVQFNPDELLDSKVGSIGWVGANMMPLHSVSDEVLKMVWKIVVDIHQESMRAAINDGTKLKQLQDEMFKAGFKDMSIFHERDENGNKTGFLLTKHNWGKYNEAEKKMHENAIAAINRLRDDKETHIKNYNEIDRNTLSFMERKVYDSVWKAFNSEYKRKVDESYVPHPPKNPKFDEVMSMHPTVREYYKELHRIHEETRGLLPKTYAAAQRFYFLPQIRMDDMQILSQSNDTLMNKLKLVGNRVKQSVTIMEDDQGYGDTSGRGVLKTSRGTTEKMLPIYFVRELNNMKELSNDTTAMYANFSEMARNYKGLSNRISDLFIIQNQLGERNVYKSERSKKAGEGATEGRASREYEAFMKFMDMHVFGETRQDLQIQVGNKVFKPGKAVEKVINYARKNNLFMNVFTILSGAVKSNIDTIIDAVAGTYITRESQAWATAELARNSAGILTDFNAKLKRNKLSVMLEYSGAAGDLKEIFKRLDLNNPLQRFTADDFWYGAYEPFSFQVKAVYALAVYDNYRFVNGKFINKAEFEQLHNDKSKDEVNKMWSELKDKTYYNAFEVVNGNRVVTKEFIDPVTKKSIISEKDINRVEGIIASRTKAIEGNLGQFDKPAWNSNIIGLMTLMHRGWMIQGATDRLKKSGVDYRTGLYDEGFYRTVGKMVASFVKFNEGKIEFSAAFFKDLQPYQKRNLARAGADLAFTALLMTLFLIMNAIADEEDDDNWGVQFAAYLTTRMFLEQGAFSNPGEFNNILSSITPLTNTLNSMGGVMSMFTAGEEIKYGVYEGLTRFERGAIKISFIKNIFEAQDPASKNKFVKNQILGN